MALRLIQLTIGFMLLGVGFTYVSDICISCLCNAASGCNRGRQCVGDSCGPFVITWAYWHDGGKHTVNGISPDAYNAYSSCASDYDCSVRTIRSYMQRFERDCNSDGQMTCFDYMAVHSRGMNGCYQGLPSSYDEAFKSCARSVGSQPGHMLSVLFRNRTTITNEILYEIKSF